LAFFRSNSATGTVPPISLNQRAGRKTHLPIGWRIVTSAAPEDMIVAAAKTLYRAKNGDRNP
jgi:hypothetical protein